MKLTAKRLIIFTADLDRMATFYRDRLGLRELTNAPGWQEFDAGGIRLALHRGRSTVGQRAPKIAFYARDVAAVRAKLIARGVAMGKVQSGPGLEFCDGRDPDGNAFSISNRR